MAARLDSRRGRWPVRRDNRGPMAVRRDSRDPMVALRDSRVHMAGLPARDRGPMAVRRDSRDLMAVRLVRAREDLPARPVSRVPVRQDRDRAADMDGPPVRLERVLSLADSVTGIRAERDPETGRLNWLPLWKRNVSPTMIQTRRTTSVSTIRSM